MLVQASALSACALGLGALLGWILELPLLSVLVPVGSMDHVWLCGPFAMINDARAVMAELGVPAERVHFELFYVDEPPPELHRAGHPAPAPSQT